MDPTRINKQITKHERPRWVTKADGGKTVQTRNYRSRLSLGNKLEMNFQNKGSSGGKTRPQQRKLEERKAL